MALWSLSVTARHVISTVICFSGGLLSKTEMSEVLTEIVKADPNFDKDSFLKQCERDIIPNILEVNTPLVCCFFSYSYSLHLVLVQVFHKAN